MSSQDKFTEYTGKEGNLKEILNVPEDAPVALVFGDPMYDVYWDADIKGISSEAPLPIFKIEGDSHFYLPGGASNVMANLCALGINAYVVYPQDGHRPEKHRVICNDHQVCRFDFEDYCEECSPSVIKTVLKEYKADAIVISDYNKGAFTEKCLQPLKTWLKRHKSTPVFVDTKKDPTPFPDEATYFPNYAEYNQYKGEYSTKKRVILKRGEEGLQILEYGELRTQYDGIPVPVVSVNGAGDSTMAGYIRAILRDHPNPAYYANLAGAVSVCGPYTTLATHQRISELHRKFEAAEEIA